MANSAPSVRPRRSALYMPGANPRALEKAKALEADVLIFDLEDAVAPDAKSDARNHLAQALRTGGYGRKERVVRVNGLNTAWIADDIASLAGLEFDAILLPKVEAARDIVAAERLIEKAGIPSTIKIWAMIETPRAFFRLEEIATASPRLETLVMGTSDLVKDLRARHTVDRIAVAPLLVQAVAAARAYGLAVLDGVHLALNDDEGLNVTCRQGRDMGFDGKSLIHPRQIAAANLAFGVSAEQAADARDTIEAYADARAKGLGVVVVDGKLVEELHVIDAERTLALWRAAGNEQ